MYQHPYLIHFSTFHGIRHDLSLTVSRSRSDCDEQLELLFQWQPVASDRSQSQFESQ
jgi:hypothetical protein